MTKRERERMRRLLPAGIPRYIRCYDNGGESIDRYTVVYTGRYRSKTGGMFWYVAMSAAPFHPQGVGCHGEHSSQIDRPTYRHLGRRISFSALPDDCKALVYRDYGELWDLPIPKLAPKPSICVLA